MDSKIDIENARYHDEKVKSIRHSDYRKGGQERRKEWDSADPDAAKNIEWVAFKPDEIEPTSGDLRCYPRDGGTHCDICMDAGCSHIVGGNIGDDLVDRQSSSAPAADMYIASSAEKIEAESGEESDDDRGIAEMKITRSRLRQIIKEEVRRALDETEPEQDQALATRQATKLIPKHSEGVKVRDPDGNELGVEAYEDEHIPDHRPDKPTGTMIKPGFTLVIPDGEEVMTTDWKTIKGPKEIKAEDLP